MFNTEGFAGRERTSREQHRRPIKIELPAKNKTKADTKPLEAGTELSKEEIEHTLKESPLYEKFSEKDLSDEKAFLEKALKTEENPEKSADEKEKNGAA